LAFDCSPRMLACADIWNLITKAGRLDLPFNPSGTTENSRPGLPSWIVILKSVLGDVLPPGYGSLRIALRKKI